MFATSTRHFRAGLSHGAASRLDFAGSYSTVARENRALTRTLTPLRQAQGRPYGTRHVCHFYPALPCRAFPWAASRLDFAGSYSTVARENQLWRML